MLWLCCCGCGVSRADECWTYCGRTTDYGGNGKYIGMLTRTTPIYELSVGYTTKTNRCAGAAGHKYCWCTHAMLRRWVYTMLQMYPARSIL